MPASGILLHAGSCRSGRKKQGKPPAGLKRRTARLKNVFIESGGITWLFNSEYYPYPSAVKAILEARDICGMEKLMWGSDYPRTMTAVTYRMSWDFVDKSPLLTAEEKQLFFHGNAHGFYRFGALPNLPFIHHMAE